MPSRPREVSDRISFLKEELKKLWDKYGKTNPEILRITEEIDNLLNEHDHLLLQDEKVG